MRLASLLFVISTMGFAETWSGYLVDSRCYASQQTNVSSDTTTVSRDMNMELRQCAAKADTKKFAVVTYDWRSVKLDAAANERAAELVRHAPKHSLICVTVRGSRVEHRIVTGTVTTASIRRQH